MKENYFSINESGSSIRCKLYYNDLKAVRRTVVCVHGFGGHKDNKAAQRFAEHLLKKHKDAAAVTYDAPCHGDDVKKTLTLGDCDLYLREVICWVKEHFKPEKCDAYATSFGGFLAVLYLGRHPGCFDRLLLRSPALRMARVLKSFLTDEQLAAFRAGTKLDFGFTRPLLLDGSFLADLERPDHDAYAVPAGSRGQSAAVIHGDADDVVPVGDSLSFAERNHLPVRIVHGADHRYKNPGELDQIVAFAGEFLGTGRGT